MACATKNLKLIGALGALLSYILGVFRKHDYLRGFTQLRENLGRAIFLGLEFLVIADIIGTVAIRPTLESVGILGGIVIIRTFLSFALQIEIEGQLPWRNDSFSRQKEKR